MPKNLNLQKFANFTPSAISRNVIKTKADLQFYLKADRIANGWMQNKGLKTALVSWFFPDDIRRFQEALRAVEYYSNCEQTLLVKIRKFLHLRKFRKLSLKLGFSIPENVFGPGLSIAHYGAIVVNQASRVGANCRLHTGVNIGSEAGYADRAPKIGDNCYIGPGVKIFGDITIANNVAIGANAVITKSIERPGVAVAGVPGKEIGPVNVRDLIIPAKELAELDIDLQAIQGMSAIEVNQWLTKNNISL